MYSMKEVCQLLHVTEYTLRYYTDEGLVPSAARDKNNRRIFDEEAIDWLRGIIYLRGLDMSIEAIKEYVTLCLMPGREAIEKRLKILEEQEVLAEKNLQQAQKRLAYLRQKIAHEKSILNHEIPDNHNPRKKHH